MSDWSVELDFLMKKVGMAAANAARAARFAFDDKPFEILTYRGYGNNARAHVYGRVVEKTGVGASGESDSTLRNLLNTYRRADSDPVRGAQVHISLKGRSVSMTSDSEGYFGGWIEGLEPSNDDDDWQSYKTELTVPALPEGPSVGAKGEIIVPPSSAKFGVISDIDDTVIQSRVSNFLLAARTVMLGNARTRLPFPGVAAFYRALRDGRTGKDRNPVFYVSSSPWNIYDVISEFMELQNIPKGPLLLRDWDIGFTSLASSRHFDHKGEAIRNILTLYPDLPFILIGDTSQHDPEIYSRIVSEFKNRIIAIYIRDVTRSPDRTASVNKLASEIVKAGSSLVLAEDTLGAARHAADQGWIKPEALGDVGDEKKEDEGTEGNKVETPGGGEPGTSKPPTVVEG